MIEVIPATAEHVRQIDGSQSHTLRGLTVLRNGEIAALAGYLIEGGKAVVFSRIVGRLPAITIVKVARQVIDMAAETGLPVLALPEPEISGSKRFLEYLGFKFDKED